MRESPNCDFTLFFDEDGGKGQIDYPYYDFGDGPEEVTITC